jgi:hypothetical protein
MRFQSALTLLALGACSPSEKRNTPASSTTQFQSAGLTAPPYRITSADSLPRAPGLFAPQLWVNVPTYLSEDSIAALGDRIRDSVAQVHPDVWSIELRFETPGSPGGQARDVARRVWGPDGKRDIFGRKPAPRSWSGRYNPPARDSILILLSEYGHSFGDNRASVVSRLGTPDSTVSEPVSSGADTVLVLWYPYASFHITRRNADQLEMLMAIRAWRQKPELPSVVSFGTTTRAQLEGTLGPPDFIPQITGDSTALSYQWFGPDSELIELTLVNDTLRLVRWRFRMG